MESCRVFSYSPNNIYANDYYNACNKFDKIRKEVIDYEHSTTDRESPAYRKMLNEFNYWDAKVPEKSNIAGKEEDRIRREKELENRQGNNPYMKMADFAPNTNHKLDFYA